MELLHVSVNIGCPVSLKLTASHAAHVYGRDETWGGGARPRQNSRGFGQKDTCGETRTWSRACESKSQNKSCSMRLILLESVGEQVRGGENSIHRHHLPKRRWLGQHAVFFLAVGSTTQFFHDRFEDIRSWPSVQSGTMRQSFPLVSPGEKERREEKKNAPCNLLGHGLSPLAIVTTAMPGAEIFEHPECNS